jgi:hypothetical protein
MKRFRGSYLTEPPRLLSGVVRSQDVVIDMNDNRRRPFYTEYAWAFALLIERPVREE